MSVLSGIFAAFRDSIMRDLRVAFPARVESYDATKQSASVQPLVRDFYEDEEGNNVTERLPVVTDVPVHWPSGGGAFLTLPLAKGDTGLVVCTDRSLDVWLAVGGEVQPGDVRCHNLSDAVFLPGVFALATPRSGSSSTHAVFHAPTSGQIHLGEVSAAYAVALAENVTAALTSLKNALSGWTPVPNDGGAALKTALSALIATPWPPTNLGSTTVKVKG